MSAIIDGTEGSTGAEFFELHENQEEPPLNTKTSSIATSVFNYFFPRHPYTQCREFRLIPDVIEKFIGGFVFTSAVGQGGGIVFHKDLGMCQKILSDLKVHSIRNIDYSIVVLDIGRNNATCYPGGKIAIDRGYLDKIDRFVSHKKEMGFNGYVDPETGKTISYENVTKKDVLAALIGHEMIHADARHGMRVLEQELAWSILSSAAKLLLAIKLAPLIGTVTAICTTMIIGAAVEVIAWSYFSSRDHHQEFEADQYGMINTSKAGYSVSGSFFLQVVLNDGEAIVSYDSPYTKFFMKLLDLFFGDTHPSYQERQKALFDQLSSDQFIAVGKPTTAS
ncbi:M48 family metalloprotease [Candidatus Neptunichlamydia sp. REUL1]|uniref:M48 family metalloprotease n=1 Tax=Candidatus Neptunichlamydia sp. REUL1 TaxID=3064277 RepID=UPI00292D5B64|nr:M48 family metalloprotease [Candidatus Neptunochlamydia sp. REUL1]